MGASYSRAIRSSRPPPPVVYTLDNSGVIVPVLRHKKPFDNSPIVKVEKLQHSTIRTVFKKLIARCSFSPGWIRYERLLESIADLSPKLFSVTQQQQLELRITSPVLPLDMTSGDRVKDCALKRYDVSVSLCYNEGSMSSRSASKLNLSQNQNQYEVDNGAIWTTQVQDWRRFDSRKVTWEAQLRALEAVDRYLEGEKERYLNKVVKMLDLDDEEGKVDIPQKRPRGQKIKI